MSRLLTVLFAASVLLAAAPASAEDCTYTDQHGKFTVTVDCQGLEDFTGIAQEQKRVWLAGTWGQLQIMELPEPNKTADLDFIMSNLGRFWSTRKTVAPTSTTTVAGIDARTQSERRKRTTSTVWVFQLDGTNLLVRAVAYGAQGEREERLEMISQAFVAGFKVVQ
jgi:hypothetical protein